MNKKEQGSSPHAASHYPVPCDPLWQIRVIYLTTTTFKVLGNHKVPYHLIPGVSLVMWAFKKKGGEVAL